MLNNLLRKFVSESSIYPTIGFDFLFDNLIIPAVHVERKEKHIICVSCMKGCPIGCKFCSSGKNYFGLLDKRQIYTMVYNILKYIPNNKKDVLLSFMGAGEPSLNSSNIIKSIEKIDNMVDRFAISTSGVGISTLSEFDIKNMKIQLSVHSVNDVQRKRMIPSVKLDEIMSEISKMNNVKIDYNFIFIKNLNDNKEIYNEIINWCDKWGIEKIKVNKFHPQNGYIESQNKNYIIEKIKYSGIIVEEYETDGADINVSCGQMKVRIK